MTRLLDNLQMTFINRSVVISRAVTILRSNETYLCIEGLRCIAVWDTAALEGVWGSQSTASEPAVRTAVLDVVGRRHHITLERRKCQWATSKTPSNSRLVRWDSSGWGASLHMRATAAIVVSIAGSGIIQLSLYELPMGCIRHRRYTAGSRVSDSIPIEH